eukprot:1320443-Amorphochlora_amoeboformis.AAC.1
MGVSIGAYSMLYGWPYACGLVGLIYVHEMGHVFAMRQRNIKVIESKHDNTTNTITRFTSTHLIPYHTTNTTHIAHHNHTVRHTNTIHTCHISYSHRAQQTRFTCHTS